jgi:hypothetical protein
MRILLAPLLIWIIGMGSISLYMREREVALPQPSNEIRTQQSSQGSFALDITLSFTAETDTFAVRPDKDDKPATLLVRANGEEILRRDGEVPAGIPVSIEQVKKLFEGVNELYVESSTPSGQADQAHAIRVRVFRDGKELTERTFWSQPSMKVSAAFSIDLRKDATIEPKHEP